MAKLYFIKAVLIENNNKENRRVKIYEKQFCLCKGGRNLLWFSFLTSFCSMSNFIFHGIVYFSLQVRLSAGLGSQSVHTLWEMLQQHLL